MNNFAPSESHSFALQIGLTRINSSPTIASIDYLAWSSDLANIDADSNLIQTHPFHYFTWWETMTFILHSPQIFMMPSGFTKNSYRGWASEELMGTLAAGLLPLLSTCR